ncbi:MAG: zinc carboxypeptidase [Oligoflexia bacterium]|nr:zinc carboxypeptidase [Oligoflexia bacterium]
MIGKFFLFLRLSTFCFLMFSFYTFATEPGLHFVHIKAKNLQERSQVANIIPIDQIIEDSIYSLVNEHDYNILKKTLSHLIIESHFLTIKELNARYQNDQNDDNDDNNDSINADEDAFPNGEDAFHTYKEVNDELKAANVKYPKITQLLNIGKSLEGRDINGIRISSQVNSPNIKNQMLPGILFVSLHHAREHVATEMPIKLMEYLLKNYDKDPVVKKLIDSRDIYIVPMINPDGGMFDIKDRTYQYWRKNRRDNGGGEFGTDLNRNYSYFWGTGGSSNDPSSDVYMGSKPFSEPETAALKNFVETHANIRVLLTFHTYSELILYPWGHKNAGVGGKDEEVFVKMGQAMSLWNKYTPERASDLYIASGDTCDWAYGEHQIFCFTFELSPKSGWFGGGFYPGAKAIEPTFNANLKPMMYLLEYSDSPYRVLTE